MSHKRTSRNVRPAVTVLELVVAMAIMVVVFTAIVPLCNTLRRTWASRQTDAEALQQGRVLIDHLNHHLSKAVRVTDVSSPSTADGYIVFETVDGNSMRYDIAANGMVEYGPAGSMSYLAGPVDQLQFTCYDGNDFSTWTTDPNAIRFVTVETRLTGSAGVGQSKTFATNAYLRSGMIDGMDSQPAPAVDPGAAAVQKVDWGGNGTAIDSFRSSQGPYDPGSPGGEAVVAVNATSSNKFVLYTNTILRGDAYVGPGGDPDTVIDIWNATITGVQAALEEAVEFPTFSAPTGPPFDGSNEGNLVVEDETVTINCDRYFNKLQIWGDGKVVIDGDVTVLLDHKFEVGENGELEILANSSLHLYCSRQIDLWGTGQVNTSTQDATRLRIFMIGSGKKAQIGQSAKIYAVLQNPTGKVDIWDNAEIFGKVKALQLRGGGKLHIDLDADFDGGG